MEGKRILSIMAAALVLAVGGVAVRSEPEAWRPQAVWLIGEGSGEDFVLASGALADGYIWTATHVVEAARANKVDLYGYVEGKPVGAITWQCRGGACKSKAAYVAHNPSAPPAQCRGGWLWYATAPFDSPTAYQVEPTAVFLTERFVVVRVGDELPHLHPGMSGSGLYRDCRLVGVLSSVSILYASVVDAISGRQAPGGLEVRLLFVRIGQQ
jgi:hypothetical protein